MPELLFNGHSGSINTAANWQIVYDLSLVIKWRYVYNLHCFRDITIYFEQNACVTPNDLEFPQFAHDNRNNTM